MRKISVFKSKQPLIYIDGQNFLFKIAPVLKQHNYIKTKDDIIKFDFRYLFEEFLNTDKLNIRYYGAKLGSITDPQLQPKARRIADNIRQLINTLKQQDIRFIQSGRLKVRDGHICKHCKRQELHLQEKGVDVQIAVDLVNIVTKKQTIYLVSSDTDLLPAIKASKAKVIYIGFHDQLVHSVASAANTVQIIPEEIIIKAYKRANNL